MRILDILPSAKFTTIVGSIALATLLIYGAYVLTHPITTPSTVAVETIPQNSTSDEDWRVALQTIEGDKLNTTPSVSSADVDALLKAASSDNITTSVGRKLLINLSQAKSQGLGSDIPTQDALIADAVADMSQDRGTPVYETSDLTLSKEGEASVKAYANSFMIAGQNHPKASYALTIYTLATSTDNGDPKRLSPLTSIAADYKALAHDLAEVPVPSSLAPIHLQILNNFARISTAVTDIKLVYTDPLRALAALQLYEALNQETVRLFINVAQGLSQNGIIFSKDEPGAAWSSLVP